MGIEPTLFAWEARVLPLNDTRKRIYSNHPINLFLLGWPICALGFAGRKSPEVSGLKPGQHQHCTPW